jgi:hypothetical protein
MVGLGRVDDLVARGFESGRAARAAAASWRWATAQEIRAMAASSSAVHDPKPPSLRAPVRSAMPVAVSGEVMVIPLVATTLWTFSAICQVI